MSDYKKGSGFGLRSKQDMNTTQTKVPVAFSSGDFFDGKRHRKAIQRKTVDYYCTVIKHLDTRCWQRNPYFDQLNMQPDPDFIVQLLPSFTYGRNPMYSVTTKHVHTSTNKQRCPVNCVTWTPEGRRLITGSSSGEFTLWNGLTFNFETILQAHDKAVRAMAWSHNGSWMVSADDDGMIKYWQPNMNNLKAFKGHKDVIRDLTFAPNDVKFASCSDDGTIRIWNFLDATEERVLTGHGWDVKCIDWHPSKGLLASGSKDNLAKLWDPKTGKSLSTLHGHKNTILGIEWNSNGNWLLTASRDQLIRVYDIRTMKELQTFKGHKKEVASAAWHPIHEELFVSGGADGSMNFWKMGEKQPVGKMENGHDSAIWSLGWHPMGHILASGSNDFSTRFWTRNRPGDLMRDRFDMSKQEAEALGLITHVGGNASMSIVEEEPEQPAPSFYSNLALPMTGGLSSLQSEQKQTNGSSLPGLSSAQSMSKSISLLPGLSSGGSIPGLGNEPRNRQGDDRKRKKRK